MKTSGGSRGGGKTRRMKTTTADGPPCAKCNLNEGKWIGPTYVGATTLTMPDYSKPSMVGYARHTTDEHLRFVCVTCGYVRTEPCKTNGGGAA